ncbi:helix-turn-helix transcriptional regulator [Liquorilactobacillus satsumensis]|uniref:helix-turn-helix transcriptional regulator n=1 Tax=Liquorilactobacillus satsumensis TaxID=259059 RepID=UPI0039EC3A67
MKKNERLNLMMRYINNRGFFKLNELQQEFHISRATALRDVADIEAMGLPLETTVGRGGGYAVMPNTLLPTIRFTHNQVKALFIAFMASRNQQLPYLKNRQDIVEKLLGLISPVQQEQLLLLDNLLVFEGTNPLKPALLELTDQPQPQLEKLLTVSLSTRQLKIRANGKKYQIYLKHLERANGKWYLDCLDLKQPQRLIIAVAAIKAAVPLQPSEQVKTTTLAALFSKTALNPNLILRLDARAIAQYKKFHPLPYKLTYVDPFQARAQISEHVAPEGDKELLINWILFLGPGCHVELWPKSLAQAYKARLKSELKR